MKANPLLVRWHEDNSPIYSAAFEPGPKGRLATAGGDNNIRVFVFRSLSSLPALTDNELLAVEVRRQWRGTQSRLSSKPCQAHTSSQCRTMVSTRLVLKHSYHVLPQTNDDLGELLGSAGDDGNVLLWVPAENPSLHARFGESAQDEKETWRVRTMCRSSGSEIYDLAWSPDGTYFITGSMDNVARIYNASNGKQRDPLCHE